MTEKLREAVGGYKIWKNPSGRREPVIYLGQYSPPNGQYLFFPNDLRELGFGPGDYTVMAPEGSSHLKLFPKWHTVKVPND